MTFPIKTSALAVAAALGITYAMAGFTTVDPGEYAVLIKQFGANKGMQDEGLAVGTHWVDPAYYDVEIYDTRANKFPFVVEATTKDGQPVRVEAIFEISLDYKKVKDIHSLIGRDYFERVIEPAAEAALNDALPSQLSDQVYTDVGRAHIQRTIETALKEKDIESRGMLVRVNMQTIEFLNPAFVTVLEEKASAAQQEEIERRRALAAEQAAIKVANTAEGAKQKVIKEAEAEKEKQRLAGEGERLRKEEEAKGVLAYGQAEADVIQLKANALMGSGGELYRDIQVLGGLGTSVQFYGTPTGAPGTSTYIIDKALRGQIAVGGD